MKRLLLLVFFFAANASAQITIEIKDYVALPITGLVDGKTNYDALLARVSGLREEPGGANRLFVPDLNGPLDNKEMLAADDGNPNTLAQPHELKILWNGQVYDTIFPIAEIAYHSRGGKDPDLPGRATVSGSGRADARLAMDAAGELYLYTKSDGMIRAITGATGK